MKWWMALGGMLSWHPLMVLIIVKAVNVWIVAMSADVGLIGTALFVGLWLIYKRLGEKP